MFNKKIVLMVVMFLLLLFLAGLLIAADTETRLMRYPDISSTRIVFTYGSDLWTVPREGGVAERLTSHPGLEINPKFSPDGRWIAFTGQYDGNTDVFVIPAEGGVPKRLTYHPAADFVLGWHPDGKRILFRSSRYSEIQRYNKLFLVPLEGGLPETLVLPFGELTSYSPDGSKIAYNRVAVENRTWKRYRGGWHQFVSIYDLKNNTYEEVPHTTAEDEFPMWYKEAIYFISDRNRTMNIFKYDLKTKQIKQITDHKEYDVKWPSLGAGAIVYENGGYLYVLDLKTEKTRRIPVIVPSEMLQARPEFKKVERLMRSISLSPSGQRALLEARGEIFTVPAKKGDVRNITNTTAVHHLDPAWSPDGKWIAYLSDQTGEYEIYVRSQDGKGEETRITHDGGVYRFHPLWSPDSKKIAYSDKALRLWYVNIDEKKPVEVDHSLYARINDYSWSHDSKWLTYSRTGANRFGAIQLYSLEQKKVSPVTDGFLADSEPVFDPTGKYLYFISSRNFHPSFSDFELNPTFSNTRGIHAVTLKADAASPFVPESDEEKGAEKKDEKKDEKKGGDQDKKSGDENKSDASKPAAAEPTTKPEGKDAKKDEKKDEKKIPDVVIDLEGIGNRIVNVPIPAGNYVGLSVAKDKLFYLSVPVVGAGALPPGAPPQNSLHVYDLKKREDAVIISGIGPYDVSKDGDKVLYRSQQTLGIVESAAGKKVGDGKLNLSGLEVKIDPRAEWNQMFNEAWRIERDFYYDPNMHGLDWPKMKERYGQLLPYVADRTDLNYLIGEMIAELSTSHAYVGGGETPEIQRVSGGLLGVDFDADQGFYRFKKIYRGENWDSSLRSPLTEPGVNVKTGDYLIAVNGRLLRTPTDPYSYFEELAEKQVTLKVNSKPSEEGAREVTVQPIRDESGLRYLDWVESNRRKVAEATGGRVGYMHVPDTAIAGVQEFSKAYYAEIGKEGLVVDERFNSGGFIPDFFVERLSRKLLSLWAPREGADFLTPGAAIYGPKVILANGFSGSGGDAFPYYFRRYKIGPIIGERTWGGLVGISRNIPMLDGGFVTAPEFGLWSPDNGGHWDVENHGVDPDIEIDNRPDLVVQGHDPQLEKAIEWVKEALSKEPAKPKRPAYKIER
ncbi:MAG: PDZ domain-containing protein [Terriglobia bacterium]